SVEELLGNGVQEENAADFARRYCDALRHSLSARTAKFVALKTETGTEALEEALLIASAGHACISGHPGAGKSYLQLVLGLRLLSVGTLPVIARVRVFAGSIGPWLDDAVRSYGAENFEQLCRVAKSCRRVVVLLVDGINEASGGIRDPLLEGLHGEV